VSGIKTPATASDEAKLFLSTSGAALGPKVMTQRLLLAAVALLLVFPKTCWFVPSLAGQALRSRTFTGLHLPIRNCWTRSRLSNAPDPHAVACRTMHYGMVSPAPRRTYNSGHDPTSLHGGRICISLTVGALCSIMQGSRYRFSTA